VVDKYYGEIKRIITIYKLQMIMEKVGFLVNYGIKNKNEKIFKSKAQALAFAKQYMRNN